MQRLDPQYVTYNYTALAICIACDVDPIVAVDKLRAFCPVAKGKRGQKPQYNIDQLNRMQKLLMDGESYNAVAKRYGCKSEDALYSILRRAGKLPGKKAGRPKKGGG